MREGSGFLLAVGMMLVGIADSFAAADVFSPDKQVHLNVFVRGGRIHYAVSFNKQPVVETSPLHFFVDGIDITDGPLIALGEVDRKQWVAAQSSTTQTTPALQDALTALRAVLTQDLEPDPTTGGRRILRGVAQGRQP